MITINHGLRPFSCDVDRVYNRFICQPKINGFNFGPKIKAREMGSIIDHVADFFSVNIGQVINALHSKGHITIYGDAIYTVGG